MLAAFEADKFNNIASLYYKNETLVVIVNSKSFLHGIGH